MGTRAWQGIACEAQEVRANSIPKEWMLKTPVPETVMNVMDILYNCGIMSKEELDLTDKDATELLELLASRKVKSYDVTLAFCKRAAIAQQLLNCLTVIFFDEALDRAKELDKVFETTGKTMGPYHSLPFSIKDHFNIKGKITSAGYIAFADAVSEEDASLVAILREAGAVFYCKTTNSQTLIHLETNSNIYGRTLNPYNRGLTSGGSSGGEGALVAFHGSPIGLGSDGGGSIRGPAANCGLIGFKQTSGRVPISGTTLMMNGSMACPCVFGPICRSARDSEYFMKVVIATEPWRTEPDMVPIPWRPVELPKTLTIGVFSDDGVVRPHPPITTAIEKISKLLGAQKDIKIVPWKPFDHFRGYDIIRRLYFQDGGQENYGLMAESGEPILPLSSWVFKPSHTSHKTIEENWYWNCEREKYRKEYAAYWNSQPEVDVILCPVGPGVAPLHDTARYWGYTAVWNTLDWPACSIPTGMKVSTADHPIDTKYIPEPNEFEPYNWEKYSPESYKDAPIGLQVVGRKWDDELVLKAVAKIEEILTKDSAAKPCL